MPLASNWAELVAKGVLRRVTAGEKHIYTPIKSIGKSTLGTELIGVLRRVTPGETYIYTPAKSIGKSTLGTELIG